MTIIEKLLAAADESAHGLVKHGRDDPDYMLMPHFVGMSASGEICIVAVPFGKGDEKARQIQAVRQVFREQNVIAYAMITEAWVNAIPRNSEEGRRVWQGGSPDVMPSEAANRREVVLVGATDGDNAVQRHYAINRDTRGCMIGITKQAEISAPNLCGRMLNLLG